ncbi:hypothetical protein K523DRAFT_398039 [Schizophyllum commune Tattone D]|nr:hypothetical protein K523DRAFT_398039 [Schizophyllum commune Tattone D]
MNRPSYFLVSRTERPRPSQALYEANLALLEANSANLGADFVPDMLRQSQSDALKQVNMTPRPPAGEFEKSLSADDARAHAISCDVPNYINMRFIMEYVHDNRPFLWERSLDDPSLLLPLEDNAPLAPRGFPRTGGLGRSDGRPPTLLSCSRKITIGASPVITAFAKALEQNKINILACAAQTTIVLEADKEYAFKDLFNTEAYPFSKIGTCCVAHARAVANKERQARGRISHYVGLAKSTAMKPHVSTKAAVKSAARTKPKKRAVLTTLRERVYPWDACVPSPKARALGYGEPSSSSGRAGPSLSGRARPSLSSGAGSASGSGSKDSPIYVSSGSESDSDSDVGSSDCGDITLDDDADSGSDSSASSLNMFRLGSPFKYQY